ncbi:MAG: hypothetical protein ACSLFN_15675 [Candidatus Limnocylindrales bacterium]
MAGVVMLVLAALAIPSAHPSLARFSDADTSGGTVVADTLGPPTGLAAVGGASVTLIWTPTVDTYATGYDVRRGSASGGPYSSVATVTPGTALTATDAPATGTWYYVLRSLYQSWASSDSGQASATVSTSTSTAYAACVSQAADTTGAGDNNGYQGRRTRACVNDSSFATDTNSGTGGTQSCGTGAVPDARKDRHRLWGYAMGLPGTATSIDGIRVRADLRLNNVTGTTNVCAQLSWDAGTTWTTMQAVAVASTVEATYTFGGTADTWGRTWTLAELGTANFRVRLIDASTRANKRFDLDYLAVSVTYTP